MTTINVNLTPCSCFSNYVNIGATKATRRPVEHNEPCREHSPVLIPLPLNKWRSVTLTVMPGECSCGLDGVDRPCPHRPVDVTCTIFGEDWASSDVADVDLAVNHKPSPEEWTAEMESRALAACRERWALVKALVTGMKWGAPYVHGRPVPLALSEQRDAVYAELAEMARAEDAACEAQTRAAKAMDLKRNVAPFHRPDGEREGRPSAAFLVAYVERLIEQVSVLEAP